MPLDFFTCSSCQRRGEKDNRSCDQCQGQGVVSWKDGYLLYFEKTFVRPEIYLGIFKNIFKILIRIVLIVFGVFGILSLTHAFFRFTYLNIFFYFNQSRDVLFLYFWSSVISNLFLIYLIEEEKETKRKIRPAVSREAKFSPQTFEETKSISNRYRINVFQAFSKEMKKALTEAYRFANKLGDQEIKPVHLFSTLLSSKEAILAMNRLTIDWNKLKDEIFSALSRTEKLSSKKTICSPELKKIFLSAYELAAQKNLFYLGVLEVLETMADRQGLVQEILDRFEIGVNEIRNVCLWIDVYEELRTRSFLFQRQARLKPKGSVNRAYTAVATPFLDSFSQDLTRLARDGYLNICLDREKEMEEIFRIFESGAQSVVLVGQPGTGKTTIINGIARWMVAEEVPKLLQDKRLVSLSIANLVAGASGSGEVEERLQMILMDIYRAGNVALFIKDIHNLIGIKTAEGELDISEILADALRKKIFWLISTSNPKDYRHLIEGTGLGEVLVKIKINEPEKNTTIQILEASAAGIEGANQVYFSYQALDKAYELANRYLTERFLPLKAINLLEEVAIEVKNKRGKNSIINSEDVATLVSEKTNIPLTKITEEESEKLLNLEEKIHQRLINQDEAVRMVASALRRARTELRNVKRPIANLLFLGPTGVGKTELAKTVAEVYFGSEKNMLRFDMSEYQNKIDVTRLIGSPDGSYEGLLARAVLSAPFSLLLLDEIEKAHPDILNLFLQIMDDGRLTDATGRLIDFTNVILIGTSNAGTDFIQERIKAGDLIQEIQKSLISGQLKAYFRPEFLNRFDGVIVFQPLGVEEIRQITRLLLKKTEKQLLGKGINLEVTDEAIEELSQIGFDPIFGARALARVVQERVSDALSKYLLTGRLKRRDTIILKKGGEMEIFTKSGTQPF